MRNDGANVQCNLCKAGWNLTMRVGQKMNNIQSKNAGGGNRKIKENGFFSPFFSKKSENIWGALDGKNSNKMYL